MSTKLQGLHRSEKNVNFYFKSSFLDFFGSLFIFFHIFHACVDVHLYSYLEVKEHTGISSLLQIHGFWKLGLGNQVWWQLPLSVELLQPDAEIWKGETSILIINN